jgi:hypothetical protein
VLYSGGDHPFVRAVTYRPGDAAHPTRAVELAPTAAASAFYPFAAVAAPTPDGFTVLFQDHGGQTYLARLAPDGSVRTPAASVAVPWSLAALAWNDHGYHLAVYYDGAGPSDTRLCLVTLTPDGQPEQHPWWASPRGAIGEVQMASARDGMRVEYRLDDGTSGLRTFTSRAQGQWGIEAPAPQNDGALAAGELFALRRGADGAVSTERVAAR